MHMTFVSLRMNSLFPTNAGNVNNSAADEAPSSVIAALPMTLGSAPDESMRMI